MKHLTFIGNIDHLIDCEKLVEQCETRAVGEHHMSNITLPADNKYYKEHLELKEMASKAGYDNNGGMDFWHFKPKKNFDIEFVNIFADYVKATPLTVFISKINPGHCAPWHWDINGYEDDQIDKGELVRFHMHIIPPAPGHVFMIEDEAVYFEPRGNVYQWNNQYAWHAGSNSGMLPKYLFSFKGYR